MPSIQDVADQINARLDQISTNTASTAQNTADYSESSGPNEQPFGPDRQHAGGRFCEHFSGTFRHSPGGARCQGQEATPYHFHLLTLNLALQFYGRSSHG
jgi:hypothetical protein